MTCELWDRGVKWAFGPRYAVEDAAAICFPRFEAQDLTLRKLEEFFLQMISSNKVLVSDQSTGSEPEYAVRGMASSRQVRLKAKAA